MAEERPELPKATVRRRGSAPAQAGSRWRSCPAMASLLQRLHKAGHDFGERHFLLNAEDWKILDAHPLVSRLLNIGLFVGLLMASYNSILAANYAGYAVANFLSSVILTGNLTLMFWRKSKYNKAYLTISVLALDFLLIATNLWESVAQPQSLGPNSIAFSIIFFAMNGALFKRHLAISLNIVIYLVSTIVLFRSIGYTGRIDLLDFPTARIVKAWLLCSGVLAILYFAIYVREFGMRQLAEARRTVRDLRENSELLNENARIREQLARMNRISVVEAMATTISHEMNQPIGSALTFAEASKRWLVHAEPNQAEVMAAIEGAIGQIRRAGEIVGSIRRMAAREPGQVRCANIVGLLDAVIPLLRADAWEHGVELSVETSSDRAEYQAMVCVEEIDQVIINLVRNAIDAFDRNRVARRIEISCRIHDEGWIDVAVHDNASGIEAENAALIFDSFFTTKPGGTGLGLPICREIAERHGGSLLVESEWGVGTLVTLRIPRIPRAT